MSGSIAWYERNAESLSARYEAVGGEAIHGWLMDLLPESPAMILDVGAGTGRDAAWLAGMGHEIVAVEPASAMRDVARNLHTAVAVRWIDDSLPGLMGVTRSGLSFDFILLSAVWMHVLPKDRPRAFRKLVNLLKPGGFLALTLRQGPAEKERGIYPVSLAEIEALARDHGLIVERTGYDRDQLGREDISWTHVALRMPDDGTGALPLLRHVILNDDKSSTYKLALLRALCRVADGAAGFSRDHDDEFVSVPLGLVALTWVRLFKPLLAASLPQSPTNLGYDRLGFVKDPFRKLTGISHLDLRVGMSFSSEIGTALHGAINDAADTITKMPATYMTYPNGGPIFPIRRGGRIKRPDPIRLDEAYLQSFGEILVPRHFWRALQRFDVWIEPALVVEWGRLIKGYAQRQGRSLDDGAIGAAMVWDEPSRDVRLARDRAVDLMGQGPLYCIWTGKRLGQEVLDVDHCLPWSAWPCGDLWNLMPAHRKVNQSQKRARLPSDSILRSAQDRILDWWGGAYAEAPAPVSDQFWIEAQSSLPGGGAAERSLSDIFDALCLQRMRLKHDQQVPEWTGR